MHDESPLENPEVTGPVTATTGSPEPRRIMKSVWIEMELHQELKVRAARSQISIQDLINEYLRFAIATLPDS